MFLVFSAEIRFPLLIGHCMAGQGKVVVRDQVLEERSQTFIGWGVRIIVENGQPDDVPLANVLLNQGIFLLLLFKQPCMDLLDDVHAGVRRASDDRAQDGQHRLQGAARVHDDRRTRG